MGIGEEHTETARKIIREATVRIRGDADLIRQANDQIRFWNTPDDHEPDSVRRTDVAADAIVVNVAAIASLIDEEI